MPEISKEKAKLLIRKLIKSEKENVLWGGNEQEDGSLTTGSVDLDSLQDELFEIIDNIEE